MTIERTITIGNIVSWGMVVIAIVAGYVRLESSNSQNTKDVLAAKDLSSRVEERMLIIDRSRADQIQQLSIDMAVVKSTVISIDRALVDIKQEIRTKNGNVN